MFEHLQLECHLIPKIVLTLHMEKIYWIWDTGFRYFDMTKGAFISQLIKLKLKPSRVQLLVTIAAICHIRLIFRWYKCDYGSVSCVIYSVMTVGSCYKCWLLHPMFSLNPCFEVTLWSNYYIIMIFGGFTSDRFVCCSGIWVLKGFTHWSPDG